MGSSLEEGRCTFKDLLGKERDYSFLGDSGESTGAPDKTTSI